MSFKVAFLKRGSAYATSKNFNHQFAWSWNDLERSTAEYFYDCFNSSSSKDISSDLDSVLSGTDKHSTVAGMLQSWRAEVYLCFEEFIEDPSMLIGDFGELVRFRSDRLIEGNTGNHRSTPLRAALTVIAQQLSEKVCKEKSHTKQGLRDTFSRHLTGYSAQSCREK